MAYPNYGYNSYGYVPNYAPGYVQPQYATNPYQNMQQPQQAQAIPNTVIPPTTNKRLCISQDGRRGVKGTGRGRRRGRRRDYGETLSLTKSDIMNWKHNLENADGTRGPHFNMEQVMEAAKAVGIRFEDFDERELCMTVNMLYSDYCEVNKPYVSPERECHYYVELAKAFLEDDDGPEPSEKLALYYYCIAEDE